MLANSRNPVEVRGDILSLVSCNDTGAERLRAMMAEFGLERIEPFADYIFAASREAMRKAVRRVPDGCYRTEMELDGYGEPVFIRAEMRVSDAEIVVDYQGTSRASAYGVNSPLCYTEAYTCFGLKCIIAPAGSEQSRIIERFPDRCRAGDQRCILCIQARLRRATSLVRCCRTWLSAACRRRFRAKSRRRAPGVSGCFPLPVATNSSGPACANGSNGFNVMNVGMGGIGARPGKDGLSVTAFPSGVGAIPVEVTESECPLIFWRKEFLPDSGGPGTFRGGLGQAIEIGNTEAHPFTVSAATFDRIRNPARGRDGGRPGRSGSARLGSGPELSDKGIHTVPAGDRLIVELPGGGGLGDPCHRDPSRIRADLEAGYITCEGASRNFGFEAESSNTGEGVLTGDFDSLQDVKGGNQ